MPVALSMTILVRDCATSSAGANKDDDALLGVAAMHVLSASLLPVSFGGLGRRKVRIEFEGCQQSLSIPKN